METVYLLVQTPELLRELVRLCRKAGLRHLVPAASPGELRALLPLREAAGPAVLLLEGTIDIRNLDTPSELPLVLLGPDATVPEDNQNRFWDRILVPLVPEETIARIRSALWVAQLALERSKLQLQLAESLRGGTTGAGDLDPATSLHRETAALRTLEREWRRCLRYDWSIALVLAATDHKDRGLLNAESLAQLGKSLRDEAVHRPGDLLAHLGDGEFLAVLSETNLEGARHVAERMAKMVEESGARFKGRKLQLQCGIAAVQPKLVYRDLARAQGAVPAEGGQGYLLDTARRALVQARSSDKGIASAGA